MNKNNVIICRCEDVTLQELHDVLEEGYTTFEDVKRILRIGMGPCQASTCGLLVQQEIAKFLGTSVKNIETHVTRPLTMGVKLGKIKEAADDES